MGSGNRTTFDLGTLEQGASALANHGGNVDSYRQDLSGQIDQAIANFDGGVGADEVGAVRAKANEILDSHVNDLKTHQGSLNNIQGDTQATMSRVRGGLAPS